VWTDKEEYRHGEKIKIQVMANKDIYLDLLYIDANKKKMKILPNQYRNDNRFKGGQVHTIPFDEREFEIEVDCDEANGSKCGEEMIVATASTHKILYDSATIGIPIAGTNIAEYKGTIKTRSAKLLSGSLFQNQQLSNIDITSQETGQSTVVFVTKK
jgi:hypothetical protein